MDLIKAELERKKKQIQQSNVMAPGKSYFKRGDLAAKQEEEYWKKHKRLKTDGDQSTSQVKEVAGKEKTQDEGAQLSRKEVIRRLRDRVEPIRLFGESDAEACQRLKKLEMLAPEINKGFENDFKAAMDSVDREYLEEAFKGTEEKDKLSEVKVKDDVASYEEIMKDAEEFGTGKKNVDCDVILNFLKLVLKKWGDYLNTRSEEQRRSINGKISSATHRQTVEYIKPLFRQLKLRTITDEILECLVDIVKHLLDRNYLRANDAYLEMAIGNAPWPIGVTMVGIHARTGREKISARNVAHVLNDENQRKYIQAVKRLMTQSQKFFPTDPSKMVDYSAEKDS